jgi:hypothetical protein
MTTKPKPMPEDIPADETGEVPEAPPPPEPDVVPSPYKRSPMEDPAHTHHHLRDA